MEHYCSRKQDLPPPTLPENRRHRKKLLTTEDIWVLLRDFGLCPELCGRMKMRDLLIELGAIALTDKSKSKVSAPGKAVPRSRPFEKELGLSIRRGTVGNSPEAQSGASRGVRHYALPQTRSSPEVKEKERAAVFSASPWPSANPTPAPTAANSLPVLSFNSFLKVCLFAILVSVALQCPLPD